MKLAQTLLVYELPALFSSDRSQNEGHIPVGQCQYWLSNAQGDLIQSGVLAQLTELNQLGFDGVNMQVHLLIPSSHAYLATLFVPGKLTPQVIDSLKYQVESELACDATLLHTHLINKQGNDVTFALIEQARLDNYLSVFEEMKLKLFGIFLDGMILPIHANSTTVLIDAKREMSVWRFDRFDYAVLPIQAVAYCVADKLKMKKSHEVGNEPQLDHEREVIPLLEVYFSGDNPLEMALMIEPIKALCEEGSIHINPPQVCSMQHLFASWYQQQTPKQLRHQNLLPANYHKAEAQNSARPLRTVIATFAVLVCLWTLYCLGDLALQYRQIESTMQSTIAYHNETFNRKFKSLGQVTQDLKTLSKSLGSASPAEYSLFDWYQYLPEIFDEKQLKDKRVIITQIKFNRSRKELKVSIQIDSHQNLNQIKARASQFFTLAESKVDEREGKIETVLILNLPVNSAEQK